eukprot:UN3411
MHCSTVHCGATRCSGGIVPMHGRAHALQYFPLQPDARLSGPFCGQAASVAPVMRARPAQPKACTASAKAQPHMFIARYDAL